MTRSGTEQPPTTAAGGGRSWLDGSYYAGYQAVWAGGLALSSPYLLLRAHRDGREMRERRGHWDPLPAGAEGGVWVHAASMGEVRAALALLAGLKTRGVPAFLSVMTPTARALETEAERAGAGFVRYVPLDFDPWIRRVFQRTRPRALLICETELWPGLVRAARRRGVPTAFVSARLTVTGARRQRLMRPWLRGLLRDLSVGAQSDTDARRWMTLGARRDRVSVTGNLKYHAPAGPLSDRERGTQRGEWDRIVVLGSVRSGEFSQIAAALESLPSLGGRTLAVVVPRHPERAEPLWQRLRALGLPCHERRATADPLLPAPATAPTGQRAEQMASSKGLELLLVHTVGELRRLYALAEVGFVGGTLCPIGGHSLFEVAELGVPVLHGPSLAQVQDVAAALRGSGGAREVEDGPTLAAALSVVLTDADLQAAMSRAALRAAQELGGATERTLSALDGWGFPLANVPGGNR